MSVKKEKLNKVFWISAITVGVLSLLGAVFPSGFAKVANFAYQTTTQNFGWFYLLSVAAIVIFMIFMAFSKFGKVRLGGNQDKPEFNRFTWVAMLSCGLGIALVL